LLSLETDTPDIELLIKCIDKIVFTDEFGHKDPAVRREGTHEGNVSTDEIESQSLVVDISEIKGRKSKKRLSHSGNLSYLLDALIYHLRLQDDKTIEKLDSFGRSEEEQIGADDEEDSESTQITEQRRVELLDVCHSKVRTLVNSMVKQLKAYEEKKQPFEEVLTRLLGVLAVLRELRRCDGRVTWVEKGKTTVPQKQRVRLLKEVMLTLFGGGNSILRLEKIGEEFENSDDMARLKGLLVWLAWDCGLSAEWQRKFMEKPKELKERLERNAMMLALAQAIRKDEIVLDEAEQSIGTLTTSEMDWLKELESLAVQCVDLRRSARDDTPPVKPELGDIVFHKDIETMDLRIVCGVDDNNLTLINLDKKKRKVIYRSESMRVMHPLLR